MTKYVYKSDFKNSIFEDKLEQEVGTSLISSSNSLNGIVELEIDPDYKNDLDEYMCTLGYSYSFETTETYDPFHNFGCLNSANAPFSNVTKGDMFYCINHNKPVWYDGTTWNDAAGNVVISE